jgi:RNA polymerase sigma factor (sigma-70 family)
MDYHDYAKINRKALLELFELERQEWLDAGMSEADIHRVHFGDENEKGKGGDYRVWLNERKHTRPDHKYAPGTPAAIDAVDPDGAWISGGRGGLDETEFNIDFDAALLSLTELQRFCFVEVEMNGWTQQSVADECGITRQMVDKHLKAAKKKLKNYFQG